MNTNADGYALESIPSVGQLAKEAHAMRKTHRTDDPHTLTLLTMCKHGLTDVALYKSVYASVAHELLLLSKEKKPVKAPVPRACAQREPLTFVARTAMIQQEIEDSAPVIDLPKQEPPAEGEQFLLL